MVSEEDDNFPLTPDSKRSGGKHCPTADVSPHHESSHAGSLSESRRRTKLYHPYSHQRLTSGDRYHDRGEQILRRQSCSQYSEGMSNEVRHILNIYIYIPHNFHICRIRRRY
jgi:hypothetical protein